MTGAGGPKSTHCREMFGRLSEYIDGDLDVSLCAEIESHMGTCAPCEAFLESLRRVVDLVGRLPAPEPLPPEWRRELIEAGERLRREII